MKKKINNEIREVRCDFESSELLKAHGFNVLCGGNCWMEILGGEILHKSDLKNISEHDRAKLYCWQPTHALAIEWIRVNFGINILCVENYHWKVTDRWNYQLLNTKVQDKHYRNKKFFIESDLSFSSPQEAAEVAIKHCLTNFIKKQLL